jgi:hypothetical protein
LLGIGGNLFVAGAAMLSDAHTSHGLFSQVVFHGETPNTLRMTTQQTDGGLWVGTVWRCLHATVQIHFT